MVRTLGSTEGEPHRHIPTGTYIWALHSVDKARTIEQLWPAISFARYKRLPLLGPLSYFVTRKTQKFGNRRYDPIPEQKRRYAGLAPHFRLLIPCS